VWLSQLYTEIRIVAGPVETEEIDDAVWKLVVDVMNEAESANKWMRLCFRAFTLGLVEKAILGVIYISNSLYNVV
jgi:hypothetical protein